MKNAAIASIIFHLILGILVVFDIHTQKNVIKDNQPVIIDFVDVAELSAAPKLSPLNQKKQNSQKPVDQKPDDAKANNSLPPPMQNAAAEPAPSKSMPEPLPETKPEPKKSEPKTTLSKTPPLVKDDTKTNLKKLLDPQKQLDSTDPDAAPILKKDNKKVVKENKIIEKDVKQEVDKPTDTNPKAEIEKLDQDLKKDKKIDEKEDKKQTKNEPKKEDKKKDDTPLKNKEKDKKKEKTDDKALINLNKSKNANKSKKTDTKKSSNASSDPLDQLFDEENDTDGAPADSIGQTLTANELDAVRQTIKKCWSIPAGSQTAKDMVVDIQLDLAPDGTVVEAEIINKDLVAKDPGFRTAAETAKRAVLDPRCNPLPFPAKKYESWKRIQFRFNPEDMM